MKEMPNVLILPHSADYSEEVWMEIREKCISTLQTFFVDGGVPENAISDEDEDESEVSEIKDHSDGRGKEASLQLAVVEPLTDDSHLSPESSQKKGLNLSTESSSKPQSSNLSQTTVTRSDGRRSRSGKKAKKRHTRQKSQQKLDSTHVIEKESTSHREDDTAMSGTDQVLSSSSRFASPDESRNRKMPMETMQESTSNPSLKSSKKLVRKSIDQLKDGYVIAIYARDRPALHVSRQRVKGGGWFLDTMTDVTKRDPAAQFLVVFRNKVCLEKPFLLLDYIYIYMLWKVKL